MIYVYIGEMVMKRQINDILHCLKGSIFKYCVFRFEIRYISTCNGYDACGYINDNDYSLVDIM